MEFHQLILHVQMKKELFKQALSFSALSVVLSYLISMIFSILQLSTRGVYKLLLIYHYLLAMAGR